MSTIIKNLSKDEADAYSLVLSAVHISHRPERGEEGWALWVRDADDEKALDAIQKYMDENHSRPEASPSLAEGEYQRTFTGVWVAMGLLMLHAAIDLADNREFFIRAYGASAFHIMKGELYRSTSALMLHANAMHILANMVGVSIFGSFVCSTMGLGVGWFMILSTGIAGNLINAALQAGGHISVGASTSIFGAIGILSAYQFARKFGRPGERFKTFLPLCGGLALLGILGSGEHSDLMAHLFGFVSGIAAGLVYCFFIKRPVSSSCQTAFLLVSGFIIAAAWIRS